MTPDIKPPDAGFRLEPHERLSPLWQALMTHLAERLATLRARNDTTATLEQTENLRGRIAEIKALMALNDERKPIT